MPFRHLALAGALVVFAVSALAEDLRPPQELPPVSFAGEQYVDSAGCVFLRAGVGEAVTWVARISRERRQVCGQVPTLAGATADGDRVPEVPAETAVTVVATPKVPDAALPAPPVATVVLPKAPALQQPVARAEPVRRAAKPKAAPPVADEGRIATVPCPAKAPVARRFVQRGGGTVTLCIPEGADLSDIAVPRGYRPAWTDDRLNPLRGFGTAEGEAMQARVWTRKVPGRLQARAQLPVVAPAPRATAVRVTAKAKAAPVAEGRYLVQVGSFCVPANAARAQRRLAALGLPVSGGSGSIKGQPVQVVYAGPFAATDAAQAALRTVRGAGFGDAFLR